MKSGIFINSEIQDGIGIRVTKDFLENMKIGFIEVAKSYINVTNEAPFAYREKQLHSIIAPAMSKFTDAFLMECPINRHFRKPRNLEREKDYFGWVDYWARYRGFDFLIEIKHGFESVKSFKLKQNNIEKWDYLITKQTKGIKKDAKYLSENINGVIIIPIHIITLYENRKIGKNTSEFDLIKLTNDFQNQFNPKPNWWSRWELDEELVAKCEYESDTHIESYPAVLFFAKIEKVIK